MTKSNGWIAAVVLAVLGLTAAGSLGLYLFGAHEQDSPDRSSGAAPSGLAVVRPTRQDFVQVVEQPARIEAYEQTPIHARITGYVEKVRVDIGSKVKKGEVLAELAVPEMREELAQKQAQVAQDRIHIVQAQKALRIAQAGNRSAGAAVDLAKAGSKRATASLARWKSESTRMEKLARDRVIDLQSRDETQSQYRSAEAELDETTARVSASKAALEESEAKVEKAEADLAASRNHLLLSQADERRAAAMLGYARLVAPYDGVVTQRNVHTGHLLQPPPDGGKVTPLFVVVRTDKVRVFIDVPEAQAVLIRTGKAGSPAIIRVPALNDREFVGRVALSPWSLDPQQRTLRTEIDFDNPEGLLRPGMYAHAVLNATHAQTWALPAATVLTQDGVTFCWMVVDGKAHRTPVRAGQRLGGMVQILKKQAASLRPGEAPRWVDLDGGEGVLSGHIGTVTEGQGEPSGGSQTARR